MTAFKKKEIATEVKSRDLYATLANPTDENISGF